MKKLIAFVLLLAGGSASADTVTTVDVVRVIDGKVAETLYYYENLTLAEIGKVLGVTESRVCQIHTKAVLQLRSRLSPADQAVV